MPGLCNYIMNQMDKQNRIDGLREAVESGDLELAIGDVLGTICEFGARCARSFEGRGSGRNFRAARASFSHPKSQIRNQTTHLCGADGAIPQTAL